jgi:hypothetical protein
MFKLYWLYTVIWDRYVNYYIKITTILDMCTTSLSIINCVVMKGVLGWGNGRMFRWPLVKEGIIDKVKT